MSDLTKAAKSVGKWSAEFTSDVLGTAGGTAVVWAIARWWVLPKFGVSPPAGIGLGELLGMVIASISAYYFWRRARGDN